MKRIAILGLLFHAQLAAAQPAYPSRPIEMIVPIAPGGGMDVQARLLAELIEPELKQRIVAVNRPGAGGTIGVSQLVKATPDGYTIGAVWSGPLTASPHSQPVAYGVDDYFAVIQFSKAPFMALALKDLRVTMDLAEQTTTPMRYGSLLYEQFTAAMAKGWGGEDWCVLMRLLEEVTGDRVRLRD